MAENHGERKRKRDSWLLLSVLCATVVLFLVQGFYYLEVTSYLVERGVFLTIGLFSIILSVLSAIVAVGVLKDSKLGYFAGQFLGFFIVVDSLMASDNLVWLFGLLLGLTISAYSKRLSRSAIARELIKKGVITEEARKS